MLNGLYGSFGRKKETRMVEIVTPERAEELSKIYPLYNEITLTEDKTLLIWEPIPDKKSCDFFFI
jgi:hypothetical protein